MTDLTLNEFRALSKLELGVKLQREAKNIDDPAGCRSNDYKSSKKKNIPSLRLLRELKARYYQTIKILNIIS